VTTHVFNAIFGFLRGTAFQHHAIRGNKVSRWDENLVGSLVIPVADHFELILVDAEALVYLGNVGCVHTHPVELELSTVCVVSSFQKALGKRIDRCAAQISQIELFSEVDFKPFELVVGGVLRHANCIVQVNEGHLEFRSQTCLAVVGEGGVARLSVG